jgi:hypothetical protein
LGGLEDTVVVGVVRDDADTLDQFVDPADAYDLGGGRLDVVVRPVERYQRPPRNVPALLATHEASGVTKFAAEVRRHLPPRTRT